MSSPESKNNKPSNLPTDENRTPEELRAASPSELAAALEHFLDNMTEESYDAAVMDAYLDALDEKAPIPELWDTDAAYADFQQKLRELSPADEERSEPRSKQQRSVSLRKLAQIGLVAALTVACLLSGLVVAQASGVDVFGTMAEWTSEVFSLGPVRSMGGQVSKTAQNTDIRFGSDWDEVMSGQSNYSSMQEALDHYGVTEVTAPTWIPESYELAVLDVVSMNDPPYLYIYASYESDADFHIAIDVKYYRSTPSMQIQKTDTPPEVFYANDTVLYLIENNRNYAVAWATEHYECCITGPLSQRDNLLQIAYSMIESI